MQRNKAYFILFVGVSAAFFWSTLKSLVALSLGNYAYSHIILIPLISGFVFYLERKRIFIHVRYCPAGGVILLLAGMTGFFGGRERLFALRRPDLLSLMALSLVLVWMGGFVLYFGDQAFRAAAFPLLFLLLMIPVPPFLLDRIIFALRQGSAEALSALYGMASVPFLRKGFIFCLPGANIKIAKECSGIRSSIAVLITGLLASHFFLRTGWMKVFVILIIVPIVVLKNAIRIATISLLATYVDPSFLNGRLHHQGGILFAILAVAMLVPVLCLLQWSEKYSGGKRSRDELDRREHPIAR